MKFGYTIVYVSSVADALTFYKNAFDFETRFLDESGQYGELNTGETVLAFASCIKFLLHLQRIVLRWVTGSVLIGLGAKLALPERR